ncbi:MAG: hypothetical protein NZL93_04955, partial [Chthoniobacterales bacterium]|nr:hypothetical protein [Chthoniobacterales bacterium]
MDEEKGFVAEELVLKLQKIGGFERFLYALPMRDGNTRYGCLLLFDWGEGAKVWSEASPLEGWSVDSLEEVQCWGIGKRIPPSLRFAIEAAWLIYRCWEGWDQPLEKISLCGLVEGHPRDWVRRVSQLQKEGCSVIKLKVRPEIMHASVEAVRRIRMLLGDKVELRLDANRSFTKEEAIRFAEEIKDFSISFIEEPCRNVEDFDEIYYRTGVRIG